MPSRNVLKIDAAESFYHVYARGHSRSDIFLEQEDYGVFLNLFKRYLSNQQQTDKLGMAYPHFYHKIELLCFCLMKNHFHLMFYQQIMGSMPQLMRGVMTSYSVYFNRKYHRSGPLFESRYKASLIYNQAYLEHISRYIHLNPKEWKTYQYSSLPIYMKRQQVEWLAPNKIAELFNGPKDYMVFLEDYQDHKKVLEEIKYELANAI